MGYEDSVASVAIYAALCGAGPAHEEEERRRKLEADAALVEKPASPPPQGNAELPVYPKRVG